MSSPNNKKQVEVTWTSLSILTFVFVMFFSLFVPGPFVLLVQTAFNLVFGWIYFLIRVVPRITLNSAMALVALIALALLLSLSHKSLSWLYGGLQEADATLPRKWELRWTLAGLGLFFLIFIAGISLTSIIHQSYWLATSPKSLLKPTHKKRVIEFASRAAAKEIQTFLDGYRAGEPLVFLNGVDSKLCAEAAGASPERTCEKAHAMPRHLAYTDISEIRDLLIDHYNLGKLEQNPYNGHPLYVRETAGGTTPGAGYIGFSVINDSALGIHGYSGSDKETILIMNIVVVGEKTSKQPLGK